MRATIMAAGLLTMVAGCSHRTEVPPWTEETPEAAPEVLTPEEHVLRIGVAGGFESEAGGTRVADVVPDIETPEWTAGALTVDAAWISGDMGSVRGFAAEPYRASATYDGSSLNVSLYAGRAVMTNIYINGFSELELGRRYEFGYAGVPEGAVFASGIACSGPEEGHWTYDQGPQNIVLSAEAEEDGTIAFQLGLELGPAYGTSGGTDFTYAVFKLSPGLGW